MRRRRKPLLGPAYTYSGYVVAVHDGDTFTVDVDLGFSVHHITDVRLRGINARELAMPGGAEARDHLTNLLSGQPVYLHTVAVDKFGGRWDADVTLPGNDDLGSLLIAEGWAAAWNGTGAKPVPPWPRTVTARVDR